MCPTGPIGIGGNSHLPEFIGPERLGDLGSPALGRRSRRRKGSGYRAVFSPCGKRSFVSFRDQQLNASYLKAVFAADKSAKGDWRRDQARRFSSAWPSQFVFLGRLDVEMTSKSLISLAGELGFEPRQTESESVVLPLHHSPPKWLILQHFYRKFCNLGQGFCKPGDLQG